MPKRPPKVRMINPRGRIILVQPRQVAKLLRRGFSQAPDQLHDYNPVFDGGEEVDKKIPRPDVTEVHKPLRVTLDAIRIQF